MPELRWSLILLGVLFVAGLAWWELRRPRQAARREVERRNEPDHTEPVSPVRVHREPTISLPEIRADNRNAREPMQDLTVVEVDVPESTMIDLRVEGQRVQEELSPPEISEPDPNLSPSTEVDETSESAATVSDEPAEEWVPAPEPQESAVTIPSLTATPPTEPVVDWPEGVERRIIAVRLVAPGERFSGRAVRQALAAEGFMLGKFSIYHKAGPDGRAILSAASLTKPGTFDIDTIDTQRFGGLNLFAVLPGPLSTVHAFDQLTSTARNLNDRLHGALQDERGEPLTTAHVLALREELAGESDA